VHVTVLNATETTGLAHRYARSLRLKGYPKAVPMNGRPSGSYPTTVVEYGQGQLSDALRVARSLGVSSEEVRPEEATTATLGGGAQVVVVVGAAQAGSAAGGEEAAP
jgi:hypothetical protein